MTESISSALAAALGLNLAAVALFMTVACGTPGPANLFLLASGARVGLRRSLSTALGIAVGFAVMIVVQGVALDSLTRVAPWAWLVLQVVFSAFLLRLAWEVATAGPLGAEDEGGGRIALLPIPLGFARALGFPFLNPKAWAIAVSMVALYASGEPGRALPDSLAIAAVGLAVAAAAHSAWAGAGASLRSLLSDPRRARVFNVAMGVSLAAVVAWGWL